MASGVANDELKALKRGCGKALEDRKQIFTALQRNVNKENNMAEQHLIDMLCMRWVGVSYLTITGSLPFLLAPIAPSFQRPAFTPNQKLPCSFPRLTLPRFHAVFLSASPST